MLKSSYITTFLHFFYSFHLESMNLLHQGFVYLLQFLKFYVTYQQLACYINLISVDLMSCSLVFVVLILFHFFCTYHLVPFI